MTLTEVQETLVVEQVLPVGFNAVRDGGDCEEMPWSIIDHRGKRLGCGGSPIRALRAALSILSLKLGLKERRALQEATATAATAATADGGATIITV